MVSVIIPCYRQAHFLTGAIESVLNQDGVEIEILVVNDGSDDNTDEVAQSFGGKIRYIRKSNGGLPAARNTGIAAATGRYLFFLDADDLLVRGALGHLVRAMEGREDRLGVMGFRCFESDPANEVTEARVFDAASFSLAKLLDRNPAPPHSYLASRQWIRDVGCFNETLKSCEDWDLWIRLGLRGAKFVAAPFVGAFYRQYPGQMSKHTARMERTCAEVRWMAAQLLEKDQTAKQSCGVDWPSRVNQLRQQANHELLTSAYNYRERHEFRAALEAHSVALRRGGRRFAHLVGLLKLTAVAARHAL